MLQLLTSTLLRWTKICLVSQRAGWTPPVHAHYTRHLRDRSSVNFVRDSRTGFAVLLEKYPGFIPLVQYFSKSFLAFADPVDVLIVLDGGSITATSSETSDFK